MELEELICNAYLFRALSGTLCSSVGVGHYCLLLGGGAITKKSHSQLGGVACSLTVYGLIDGRGGGNAKKNAAI